MKWNKRERKREGKGVFIHPPNNTINNIIHCVYIHRMGPSEDSEDRPARYM